nr:PepSY domain-containing protein [uncultured Duganella sp.]
MTDQHMKAARTALLWRVHWWAALVASPFALVAALTGLLYAFTPQIEDALYSGLERVAPAPRHVALDAMVAAARAAVPASSVVHSVVVPGTRDASVQVTFAATGSARPHHDGAAAPSAHRHVTGQQAAPARPAFGLPPGAMTVFVDPADARVLGTLADEERFRQWAKRLHSRLLQGDGWRWMIELATSWLMVMLATGVALWWPKAAWPARNLRGRPGWRQWHACIGAAFGLPTLAILATGLTWSAYAGPDIRYLRQLTGQASPTMPRGLASTPPATMPWMPDAPALDWQGALDKARPLAPGLALQLTPPSDARGVWRVSMAERSAPMLRFEAALDAYSGAVLHRYGWQQQPLLGKLTTAGIPFHRGELGWWNQALLIGFGVVILFSIVSGWVMYFKRRKPGALGLPKLPAGAWRAVGPGWAVAAVAGLALMPLLALSAPCVLLIDRLLERRTGAA